MLLFADNRSFEFSTTKKNAGHTIKKEVRR